MAFWKYLVQLQNTYLRSHLLPTIYSFFQKEFQVKDWDLRLFNCDILKKTWIISGLEPDGGKEIANWFLCSGICLLVQTADAAVMTMAAGPPMATSGSLSHVSCNWWQWHQTLAPAPGITSLQMLTKIMIAIIGVIFKLTRKRWHLFNVKGPFHPKWRSGSWRLDPNTLLLVSKQETEKLCYGDVIHFKRAASTFTCILCIVIWPIDNMLWAPLRHQLVIWDMSPSSLVWVITMSSRMKC